MKGNRFDIISRVVILIDIHISMDESRGVTL